MAHGKARELRRYEAELRRAGIEYRPMIFSCFGRWHPEAASIAEYMARTAARRRGIEDPRLILRRAKRRVGVELMRRSVRLVRECLPAPREVGAALLGDNPEFLPEEGG